MRLTRGGGGGEGGARLNGWIWWLGSRFIWEKMVLAGVRAGVPALPGFVSCRSLHGGWTASLTL